MIKIRDPGRGFVSRLGLAVAAMLALSAASGQRAEALSLINPGGAPTAKHASDGLATEVRGGHGGHGGGGGFRGGGGHGGGGFHGGGFRGGGAAFHGGGFRGGGAAFRGGGFRSGGAAFHGGGFRAGPVFHGGHRFAHHRFHHRHHFHRRFYASYYNDYPYYYPYRRCRIILTYYGPRRICHWRHRWSPYW
jgi:hypothetical protein